MPDMCCPAGITAAPPGLMTLPLYQSAGLWLDLLQISCDEKGVDGRSRVGPTLGDGDEGVKKVSQLR